MRGGPVLLLATVTLAGCVAAPEPEPAARLPDAPAPLAGSPWEAALAFGHDHDDLALHQVATPNVRLAGHVPQAQLAGSYPLASQGELDVRGDLAFVAALSSGFTIVDIADAAAPEVLSLTPVEPGAYVADIKASDDGRFVFLGLQVNAPGIQVYDAQDPALPVLAAYLPVKATGCHMLAYKRMAGGEYLFCSSGAVTIARFERAPVPHLVPVGAWHPTAAPPLGLAGVTLSGGSHDMTVQDDPLTGEPVMLASLWEMGVYAVDVSDPAQPRELGHWAGEGAEHWFGAIHTSLATLVGGQRVVVSVPEFAPVPAVFVLDAADYGAMRLRSEWVARPDADYGPEAERFSTHNFQAVGARVYLAMNHGGVWVLDLLPEGGVEPHAVYLPATDPSPVPAPVPGVTGTRFEAPDTWDVVVADGRAFALDVHSGLYALEVEGDPVGDPAYDSFA